MHGGWGLDALVKFFRRRRRRRRPPGFGKWTVLEFHYEIGASRVRGSIRLVERLPKVYITSQTNHIKNQISKKIWTMIKNGQKQA